MLLSKARTMSLIGVKEKPLAMLVVVYLKFLFSNEYLNNIT